MKTFSRIFTIVLAAWLTWLLSSCNEADAWIKSYGYNPVRPANVFLMPGALLMRNDDVNTSARILCNAEASLGSAYVARKSNTVNGKFSRTKKVGWQVGTDILAEAKASANANSVSEVYVTLANAQIVHITDAEVYANLNNRSDDCKNAIAIRRAAGYTVTMVKSALVGDVTYNVKFDNSAALDANVMVAQVAALSANLGGNISNVKENSASASGLVWGIKEDMFMAAISMAPDQKPDVRRNSRMLPDDYVLEYPGCYSPSLCPDPGTTTPPSTPPSR